MINIRALNKPRRPSERRRLWIAAAVRLAASLSGNSVYSQSNQTSPKDDPEADFAARMRQLKDTDPEKRAEAMEMASLASGRHPEAVGGCGAAG